MIKLIDINKIHPHPQNPRKDLGDLTELAESIKANGILQNLTVVPWFSEITGVGCDNPRQQEEMGYRVVIGHRRLAAAKLAGLKEVPCSISDMDYKTQIATMLSENIQRSDLTAYEQAQGFQMMLDLGETVSDISKETGFSESTVRRRVKLLELDQKKLKESSERGATLQDYLKLTEIEDIKLRNRVLEDIGTENFNYRLKWAIDEEKKNKAFSILAQQLNKFAEEAINSNGLIYVYSYSSPDEKVIKPKDADTIKYFYVIHNSWIELCKKDKTKENIAKLGYKMSEEEIELQNGTHELFSSNN